MHEYEPVHAETVGEGYAAYVHFVGVRLGVGGVHVYGGFGAGQGGGDELFDGFGYVVGGVDMEFAGDGDDDFDVGFVADFAHAELLQRVGGHALGHQAAHGAGGFAVCFVHQVVDGFAAEFPADVQDQYGNGE